MGARVVAMPPADEWSDVAVSTLLDCYNDKFMELNGGSIGSKGWQDVIFKLNSVCAQGKPVYSYRRCKNKLDVMKRRFKIERDRKATNGGVSDWPWFQKMEEIVSRNPRLGAAAVTAAALVVGSIGNNNLQQQSHVEAAPQTSTQPPHHRHQEPDEQGLGGNGNASPMLNHRRDRLGSTSVPGTAAQHDQDELSAGQLFSDQQDDNEDDDEDEGQARNSNKAGKKRKRGSSGCGSANPMRHAKEIALIVTEALERMEMKRLDVMRELELKRNETQLQIARMIVESHARLQQQQQQQHNRQASTSSDPHSYVEQQH